MDEEKQFVSNLPKESWILNSEFNQYDKDFKEIIDFLIFVS